MPDTKIEWATKTYNIVEGCTKVSAGCKFCYGERLAKRAGRDFSKVNLHPERLDEPRHWRKPQTVFVCSRADLFHPYVPDAFIDRVFAVMALAKQHTFLLLTKRPERMRRWVTDPTTPQRGQPEPKPEWPLTNCWLGVSAENQHCADERIPILLDTPAAVRFLSCEPLLGPLDLSRWLWRFREDEREYPRLDWLIVGGESGGPPERQLVERCSDDRHEERWHTTGDVAYRCDLCQSTDWRPKPEALEWLRRIRDDCQTARVPFFFKQYGGPRPNSGGRLLDGREWDQFPGGDCHE